MVVHFNRLKKCPVNHMMGCTFYNTIPWMKVVIFLIWRELRVLEQSWECCGEGAFIPDVDGVAEIEESVISEQSPAEETTASEETLMMTNQLLLIRKYLTKKLLLLGRLQLPRNPHLEDIQVGSIDYLADMIIMFLINNVDFK